MGRVIVTSGVVVESTAETEVPSKQPSFRMVTLRSLHSFGSMIPLPLPPDGETESDTRTNLSTPLRHSSKVVVFPFVIVTGNGPIPLQLWAGSTIVAE